MDMQATRRDFLRAGAGAISLLGVSLIKPPRLGNQLEAAEPNAKSKENTVAEIPVLWIAAGACTGCSVSLLNSASPTIQELLLEEVLPGQHVSLGFHTTLMAASGHQAMDALDEIAAGHQGGYILVVDGVVPQEADGLYCAIGETKDGTPLTGYQHVCELGRNAKAVLAVGACSAYGGIPAAPPNPTGALTVNQVYEKEAIQTPVVNIPGCPPHPDWIVGTIATLMLGGVDALNLDELGRPAPFFRECIHDNCAYRGQFEKGNFAEHFGEHGCLIKLGCKGPITYADCGVRKFNNGTNWCIEAGHPCIGCCHPKFPFEQSMFTPAEPSDMAYPEAFPPAMVDVDAKAAEAKDIYIAVGLIGAAAFAAGAGVASTTRKLKKVDDIENAHSSVATSSGPDSAADNKEKRDE
jgi:hydrogenase small subunit